MKRVYKTIAAVILSVLTALCSMYQGYSTTVNSKLFSNNEGVFSARTSGKKAFVTKVASDYSSYTYSFPYKAIDCSVTKNKAYILIENNSANKCADIYTASNGTVKLLQTINNIKINNSSAVCADKNGNIYIKNSSANILIYDKSGKHLKTLNEKITNIIPFENYIAAYNNKNIFIINKTSISAVNNPSDSLLYRVSENYIADISGHIYKLDNNLKLKADIKRSGFYQAVETKKYFISISENGLVVYNKNNGEKASEIDTENRIDAICSFNNKVVLITNNSGNYSCSLLSEKQLEYNADNNTENKIKLNKFIHTKKYIFIDYGTTIEEFFDNISYNGYTADIIGRRSGKLKTGNVIHFTKDNNTIKYTFIVRGDVTGEGNVNSRDEAAMFNHLLEIERLKGINKLAGDLNRDKKISNADLVLLSWRIS